MKNETYYSISDKWGEMKLTITHNNQFSINFVTLSDALNEISDNSTEHNSASNSLMGYSSTFKGTIDRKKKEFCFSEPIKMTASYTISNGKLILSKASDTAFNQSFYLTSDKRLKTLRDEF